MTWWPPQRQLTLTRRGWVVLGVAVAMVVAGSLAIVIRVIVDGPADCTVRVDGRTIDLDRHEAEQAATALIPAARRGTAAPATTSALAHTLSLSADDAAAVTAAFSGRARAAVTCRYAGASTTETDRLDEHGLTPRAEAVREVLRARFGQLPLGGFAPGGVHTGHMVGSAHYEGRAIDAFVRPVSARNKQRGWALAYYLVTHAERFAIETVIFDGRIWTARRSAEGWRDYHVDVSGKSGAVARILEHRDHVHVDVAD
jgi:hypothetical protein